MKPSIATLLIALLSINTPVRAQIDSNSNSKGVAAALPTETAWQQCLALTKDATARLSCFDRWASLQPAIPVSTGTASVSLVPASVPAVLASTSATVPTQAETGAAAPPALMVYDCTSNRYSELSRFWELEAGTDCGTFNMRGYHPISLSWIASNGANGANLATATSTSTEAYGDNEARIQLSVRTKIAQGMLTGGREQLRDSLWFGYSQQSYWQLFNGGLSRPFRSTDHEPEVTYIYPTRAQLPLGWQLRYTGISAVHQSNGQSQPLSRSWNRTVLMAGFEKGNDYTLQAKLWKRMKEDPTNDDNPDIEDLIGRAEFAGSWNVDKNNTLGVTLRHALRSDANGSVRFDWYRTLGNGGQPGGKSGLRFHTRLFAGYGDSLIDYNRRRTVLSVGLSLVDW
ncbi:MAG: phospholipase A [Rhodoferax sp.]|nr:phospholipase A [Rhodoferax sp.]